jgi:hypothetical protein
MSTYPEGVAAFCKKYNIARDECWQAHKTWVVKHSAIERVCHQQGITFSLPQIVEANSERKIAVVVVEGEIGDGAIKEWSFGEAGPANNKNEYPFAMAEKRAKDRVALKLLGAHGILYSEEEAETFKDTAPEPSQPVKVTSGKRATDNPQTDKEVAETFDWAGEALELKRMVQGATQRDYLTKLGKTDRFQRFKDEAPQSLVQQVGDAFKAKLATYEQVAA